MPNFKKYFTFTLDAVTLWIYKKLLDFLKSIFIKNVCLLTSLLVVANFILFFMHYIRAWNQNAFFQQIPVQLVTLCGLTNFLLTNFAQKDIVAMIHSLSLRESLEELMKTCKFLKDAILIMVPVMTINWLLVMPWFGGTHLHFFLVYLDRYDVSGSVAIRLTYFFMFNFCFSSVVMYYFTSVCFHAGFVSRCRKLEQDINDLSEVDANTPLYQEHVEEVLKSCIKQHIFLKRTVKNMKIIRGLLFVYSIAGMGLGGNIVAYMFLDISQEEKMRFAITFTSVSFLIYKLVSLGQDVQNESEKIYVAATNTPWYQWNKSNCVLLQILLMQSINPLYVSNGINTIDNVFLIKIFKGMYTMGMFYHTSLQRKA